MKSPLKLALAAVLVACFSVNVNAAVDKNQEKPVSEHQKATENLKSFKVGNTEVSAEQQKDLYQRIAAANPKASPKVISEQVQKSLKTQAALKNEAIRLGLNKDKTIAAALKTAEMNVLAEAVVEKYIKDNPIKEEEIRKVYEDQKKAYGDKEYQLRNILVEDEEKAKAVRAEIKTKEDFARMAKLSSLDPSTKNKGGLNEFVGVGVLAPEIKAVISDLKVGDTIKDPVKTANGWQIIQIEAVRPAEKFPSYDALKGRIRAVLTGEKTAKYASDLANKATVKSK